jgi:hypothetical protein
MLCSGLGARSLRQQSESAAACMTFAHWIAATQCPNCQAVADEKVPFKRCSGCKSVRYCSRPCQEQQWTIHRDTCMTLARGYAPRAVILAMLQELMTLATTPVIANAWYLQAAEMSPSPHCRGTICLIFPCLADAQQFLDAPTAFNEARLVFLEYAWTDAASPARMHKASTYNPRTQFVLGVVVDRYDAFMIIDRRGIARHAQGHGVEHQDGGAHTVTPRVPGTGPQVTGPPARTCPMPHT